MKFRGPQQSIEVTLSTRPKTLDQWCKVQIHIQDRGQTYMTHGSCLRADELLKLNPWFTSIETSSMDVKPLTFMEPDLVLDYCAKTTQLCFKLRFDLRPPGSYEDIFDAFEFWVPIAKTELHRAYISIAEFTKDLR